MDITTHEDSLSLAETFDILYYDLAASADILSLSISAPLDTKGWALFYTTTSRNSTIVSLAGFHLPKRKFPVFSGSLADWQGFEDLFQSMLSHVPDLPDVVRFEFLKSSLVGEALSLVTHLPITASNY